MFSWDAVQELIDTGLSAEEVASIRQVIVDTPGVGSLHELRTRRMAHRSLVDAHVCVDARISVSEGHRIAEMTRKRVLDSHPQSPMFSSMSTSRTIWSTTPRARACRIAASC